MSASKKSAGDSTRNRNSDAVGLTAAVGRRATMMGVIRTGGRGR